MKQATHEQAHRVQALSMQPKRLVHPDSQRHGVFGPQFILGETRHTAASRLPRTLIVVSSSPRSAGSRLVAIYKGWRLPPEEMSMQATLETLEAEVLRLSPADRAKLLDRLIASLDVDPDAEAAWDELADRREQELETGGANALPLEVAVARLEARFPR